MMNGFPAYASDFYINQRVNLKMDLPLKRDTVLSLFDRVRKQMPGMDRLRRYDHELALETRGESASAGASAVAPALTGSGSPCQNWLAVRRTSVRSGTVNPNDDTEGYALHRLVLETAPCFLDISALDVDHVELLFGFDLPASGNHDAIVFNALLGDSPLASLISEQAAKDGWRSPAVPLDFQPLIGLGLSEGLDLQAHVEVKTRTSARQVRTGQYGDEPISLYLIVRKYGPFGDVRELPGVLKELSEAAEHLTATCVAPRLLTPIRDAIVAGG